MRPPAKSLLALACWAAALAALAVLFRAGHPAQAHLVHSDALYLPVLFADLLEQGGRIGDWFLTPAPYFFPDMPLYWLAWLSGSDVFGQTVVYALLQSALTAVGLFLVAHQVLSANRLLAAAALSILFIWLGLHVDDPFVRLFASAHHYGAFVAALPLVALWLSRDAEGAPGRGKPAAAVLATLVFLATLSDALFLVQAVVPLLAAALLCTHGARRAAMLRSGAMLLFAPAMAAMLSYSSVVAHPTRYPTRLGISGLPANLDEMGRIGAVLFGQRPLLASALLLALGLGTACMLACLRKRPLPGLPYALGVLAVFATLSCAATLGAMLLSKNVLPVPRYLIGALAWPLVAGLFALAHLLGTHFRHLGLALCLVFSGLLVHQAWQARALRDADRHYYPEQIACIDRALASTGAQYGIAQYWDAKRLQALSRQRPVVAQYTGELAPMKWITSERFFRASYDFAVIAEREDPPFRLPRAQLVAINGEPAHAVSCGDRTVLIWGPSRLRTASPAK